MILTVTPETNSLCASLSLSVEKELLSVEINESKIGSLAVNGF
jgi:hypothetical protein